MNMSIDRMTRQNDTEKDVVKKKERIHMALIKIEIFSFDLLIVKFVYIYMRMPNSHNETDIIPEKKRR